MDAENPKQKPSKAQRMLNVVQNAVKDKTAEKPGTPKAEKPEKAKRPDSETVAKWRVQEKLPADAIIRVKVPHTANGPKSTGARSRANARYALYKDGMTVTEYLEKCKESPITTVAKGNADLRWDYVKGFIDIEMSRKQ
jgi:hypothetical protein